MAMMFPESVDQFYEVPAKIAAKKREKELMDPPQT